MIKSVTIINDLDESLTIKLTEEYPEHGLLLLSMDGIGATEAEINTTDLAVADGSIYNSSRGISRNITMSLRFIEQDTIEDTRQRAYRYLPTKKKVTLQFDTDNRQIRIDGYVETNEPDIFSKEEGAEVSIICPDPYFHSLGMVTNVLSGIEPLFEFPFENDSLTEPLLEMGEILMNRERNVYYFGDADTGMIITVRATGPVGSFTIYNIGTREKMRIDNEKLRYLSGRGFDSGDELIINTKRGEKSVKLLRNGFYTNALNALERTSSWMQLTRGNNVFAYKADSGEEYIEFQISNENLYMGV